MYSTFPPTPPLLFFLSPSSDYFGIHLFMFLCTLEIAVVLCLYFVHYLWNSIPILHLLFGPILIYSNPCFLTDSSCVVFILSSGHAIPYTASIFYFSGLSYMLKWERTVVWKLTVDIPLFCTKKLRSKISYKFCFDLLKIHSPAKMLFESKKNWSRDVLGYKFKFRALAKLPSTAENRSQQELCLLLDKVCRPERSLWAVMHLVL